MLLVISVKFYSLFWDSVLLVSFNEYKNRQRLTQRGSKDVDEILCILDRASLR